jgi:hypothetical protein
MDLIALVIAGEALFMLLSPSSCNLKHFPQQFLAACTFGTVDQT